MTESSHGLSFSLRFRRGRVKTIGIERIIRVFVFPIGAFFHYERDAVFPPLLS